MLGAGIDPQVPELLATERPLGDHPLHRLLDHPLRMGAKDKKILWRGTITNTIANKPEKNEKKINKGTEKLFKKFPPK